jgi:hypothetical protein
VIAVATTQEHWVGFAVVVGLMLLFTAMARGGLGVVVVLVATGITWAVARGDVQPTDVNDRSTVGLLFLGAIIGCAAAFLLPTKRGA